MKKLLLGLTLATCSCQQLPAITGAVVGEVTCVEAQLGKGAEVYEDIALACVPLAVTDVVTIVTALETPDDAGPSPLATQAKKVHHR